VSVASIGQQFKVKHRSTIQQQTDGRNNLKVKLKRG